jgi:hypothetical protein
MTGENRETPIEVFKQVNICIRDIIALTPKPGPSIDDVLNDVANELGVTRETMHDWGQGKGTVEPWQLDALRKKVRMLSGL